MASNELDDGETTALLKKEDDTEVERLEGCGASLACDPSRSLHRYLVLIIMCFLSFGSYFCYDNPAALQDTMEQDLEINTSQFMAFYAWYSWPNVFLCFCGGYLIDRVFGLRLGGIIFSLFVAVGQVIFALGAILNKYWLMCFGRFVFGVGGESLCVAQNNYAVNWFMGKELNMVFGLQLSFSRVGSTLNMNIMQRLYKHISRMVQGYVCLGISLFIACGFCVLSVLCALAMAFFDKRSCRILKKSAKGSGEVISLWDIKDFSVSLWLLCAICVFYYVTIFPFIGLGQVFFEMKYHFEPNTAVAVNSIVFIVSAVASPFFGFAIDKIGHNVFWVITGVVVTLGCHALLAFTFINPFIPMVIMGLAYSVLASALWPLASLVVPVHQLGTAYGIMQSVQNLGLASVALISGKIVDSKGYLILLVFYLTCLCVALISSVILYMVDAAKGGVLNRSARMRRKLAEVAAKEEEVSAEPVTT